MIIFLTFLIAWFVSFFSTPLFIRIAVRFRVMDEPRDGKIHSHPIPRLGGLAIFFAFLLASALAFILSRGKMLGEYDKHYLGIIAGGLIIVALGIYDDTRGAKAPVKLLFQVIAAVILLSCGYSVHRVTNPLGGQIGVGFWGIPLIIIWIVGLTNAVNLIDGLDGLACGVAIITGATLFVASSGGPPFVPVLAVALTGACAGFLRYNFYPAKIFLGDTGSLFLGFVLAAISIQGSFKTTAGMALVLPLVALLIPIADTTVAFFRRIVQKRHPFQADQRHVHHKLLSWGYSHKQAVLLLYLLQINLGAIALLMKYAGRGPALGMFILMVVMLLIFFRITTDIRRNSDNLEAKSDK